MPFQIIRNDITKVTADAIVNTANPEPVIGGSIFDDLKRYIDDNYVSERNEEEYAIDESVSVSAAYRENREARPGIRKHRRAKSIIGPRPHPSAAEAPMPCSASLEDILKQHEKTFSEYLLDLLKERDGRDSEVYKRAEVSKQLFSKILNNKDYQPTKSTAIQLALGLQLNLAQTQKLLGKAGYALTRSSKVDLVVQYYIEREIYNVTFINEALDDCGLPLLKTGLKS